MKAMSHLIRAAKQPLADNVLRTNREPDIVLADKIRVLIADDHTTVVAGLTSILGMQPDMVVVAEATNGSEAVDLWKQHSPDVTLLDLRMPKLDGVGALTEIHRLDASARVVVLTTYDTDADIYRAIKAGAKGYLLKDARREELLDCIRKVNAGETCIPQALITKLATGISNDILTDRELDVLNLLACGRSNKQIGATLFISEFTVKGHLRNVFTKLNVLSRTEAISVATRRGLIQV
jgi:DNA-binding NarL/FixJ family response regulator